MMPAEVTAYFLKHGDLRLRLEFQIVLQCAPFLKGLKASCLITLDEGACRGIPEFFCGTGVDLKILGEKRGKGLVFLYRREELEEYVSRPEIRGILGRFGYRGMELEEMLDLLAGRIHAANREDKGFPHEIGAFLGYPAADVEGFIRTGGSHCLAVGYWKVYHDMPCAARTFHTYDEAKQYAVNEFLSGKSLQEILGKEE
ncbi:DUF3793 family protein [Schaedlerella arabinosiphila]|uniref:DUF3793 family protein n=1 Tax=Schaedlerella arabinosiphila TaxID=2044587 RepID=UPI002557DA98|nr:DUF3793 family protein [Schaedlerella arabinosiphila]MCI9632530.1 DUF3793 family protein [Ruminococcus sp.]